MNLPLIVLLIILGSALVLALFFLVVDLFLFKKESPTELNSSLKVIENAKIKSLQIITSAYEDARKNMRVSDTIGKEAKTEMEDILERSFEKMIVTLDTVGGNVINNYQATLNKSLDVAAIQLEKKMEEATHTISSHVTDSYERGEEAVADFVKKRTREAAARISSELPRVIEEDLSENLTLEVKEEIIMRMVEERLKKVGL